MYIIHRKICIAQTDMSVKLGLTKKYSTPQRCLQALQGYPVWGKVENEKALKITDIITRAAGNETLSLGSILHYTLGMGPPFQLL